MIRIMKMSGKYYGLPITSVEIDADNIVEATLSGDAVILVESLDDLQSIDIDKDEVKMVEPD